MTIKQVYGEERMLSHSFQVQKLDIQTKGTFTIAVGDPKITINMKEVSFLLTVYQIKSILQAFNGRFSCRLADFSLGDASSKDAKRPR